MKNLVLFLVLLAVSLSNSFAGIEPNLGQWLPKEDLFILRGKKSHVSFGTKQVIFYDQRSSLHLALKDAKSVAPKSDGVPLSTRVNSFTTNDPKNWITNIPTYSAIRYSGVYPGVDQVYQVENNQVRYNFEVAPEGSSQDIVIGFQNASKIEIQKSGELVVSTKNKKWSWGAPKCFERLEQQEQLKGTQQKSVPCFYSKAGTRSVRFRVASYDRSKTLVIDPILETVYFTFIGASGTSSGVDKANAIAVDSSGSAYVTGSTTSSGFAQGSVYQNTLQGGTDAFIAKVSQSGTSFDFITYFGGVGDETGRDIKIDPFGAIWVVGKVSNSYTGYPLTTWFSSNTTDLGNSQAFFARFNSSGNQLFLSGRVGVNKSGAIVEANSIDVIVSPEYDISLQRFEAWIGGSAQGGSSDGGSLVPTYSGGLKQVVNTNNKDGLVFRVGWYPYTNPTYRITAATLLGACEFSAAPPDSVNSIQVLLENNAPSVWVGGTFSSFRLKNVNCADVVLSGNAVGFGGYFKGNTAKTAFVANLGLDNGWGLNVVKYFTFLPESGNVHFGGQFVRSLNVDSNLNVIAAGGTGDPDSTVSASNVFVTKFNRNDNVFGMRQLIQATTNRTEVTGMAVDSQDSIYLSGWTSGNNFPTFTPLAPESVGIYPRVSTSTSLDGWHLRMSKNNLAPSYYYNWIGGGSELLNGIAISESYSSKSVWVAGESTSTVINDYNSNGTPGYRKINTSSSSDAFVSKVSAGSILVHMHIADPKTRVLEFMLQPMTNGIAGNNEVYFQRMVTTSVPNQVVDITVPAPLKRQYLLVIHNVPLDEEVASDFMMVDVSNGDQVVDYYTQ